WRRKARTVRELEGPDAGMPVERAARREVLGRVPEGAVIHRVDRHRAVVAPALEPTPLRSRPVDQDRLCLKGAEWICRRAARVYDRWVQGGAREAVADRAVTDAVHRRAAHPAVALVRRVGALLVDGGRLAWTADPVPVTR